ncbi:MAG: hypothetical protein R3293_15460 [Candidatus Promineifilaceae bacterium]|nr:hypothetical protein [Candidatus Promineifilaceae bacterium]
MASFFDADADQSDKLAVIESYAVDYILIDRDQIKWFDGYLPFGELVYESEKYILLQTAEAP